jgi:SNW domain-containing protein 1
VTVEEQAVWVIPPCISNWKNAKGYTIPLDKRLANDGRGLQDITINDNFAKLSEALFIADRHAREEVKLRGEMQQNLVLKQKKDKEEKLRELAQKAREERELSSESESSLDDEDLVKLKERDDLRKDRERERQRDYRQSHKDKKFLKYLKLIRNDRDRDISEKVALGLTRPSVQKEGMYDQRLFNQSQGMSSGFEGNDSYSIYDKPLFDTQKSIYRPKKDDKIKVGGIDEEKLKNMVKSGHRGFEGADQDGQVRDGPVKFEKEDVFGTDEFMSTVKRGRDEDDVKNKRSRK